MLLIEQSIDECVVEDGSLNEAAPVGHVFPESPAQVVENDHTVSPAKKVFRYMRANEASAASDE
jgi:hypothetical protein